jgi:hypothetical protein
MLIVMIIIKAETIRKKGADSTPFLELDIDDMRHFPVGG